MKTPELRLGGARGFFGFAAAVVDLERAVAVVAVEGFFLGAAAAAAVPAEVDVDDEGEECLVAALAASSKTLVPLKTLAVDIIAS